MYILTNKYDVVVYITTEAIMKADGIHVGGSVVFTDKDLNIIKVDEVSKEIIAQKYCYNKEDGFYINSNYYAGGDISSGNIIVSAEQLEYLINRIDPIIDENRLSLEEMKNLQISRINKQCTDMINKGVSVELSVGVEHFSLTMEDQANISRLVSLINRGGITTLPYHSDKSQSKLYLAEDILKISKEADIFILYNTNYCNSLNTWIRRLENKDEVKEVQFDSTLPEDLKDNLDDIMNITNEEIGSSGDID